MRVPQQRAFYFYLFFVFVHKYPRAAWDEIHTSSDGMFRSSDSAAREEVYDIAWALDNIIQEINYDWRLDPHNHGPWPFDYYYTGSLHCPRAQRMQSVACQSRAQCAPGFVQLCSRQRRVFYSGIVDTCPIYCPTPHDFHTAALLYQPKYKDCVLKWQLGIDFRGRIIMWTGPHLGTSSDKTIWDESWDDHRFFSWERWLADLGYVGALGLLVKFKGHLTRRRRYFNNIHEFVRNRIEQIVGRIKNHRIFQQGVYSGNVDFLISATNIIGHVTAYELSQFQPFDAYGPWQHVPP